MQKIKKRLPIFIALALAIVACISTFFIIRSAKTTHAQEIFNLDSDVTCEKNVKVSDTFLNGKTGYKLSTSTQSSGFRLKEGIAGEFGISFIPVSDEIGKSDFTEITLNFSDDNARVDFALTFLEVDSGVVMRLCLNNSFKTKDYIIDSSFANLASKPITLSFNPQTMVVLNDGKEIVNLKSKTLVGELFYGDAIESFDVYNVDISFRGIKDGKTAKIIIFEICGQGLSGSTLKDTSAPFIYSLPKLNNGEVGVNYKVPNEVTTYDLFDGFNTSTSVDISVTDDKYNDITLTNGTFKPTKAGNYYVKYTPSDKAGNVGVSSTSIVKVIEKASAIEFCNAYPIVDVTVGVGSAIQFPETYGTSLLTSDKIDVSASIIFDGKSVYSVDNCIGGFNYKFESAGTYTVQFKATDVNGKDTTADYTVTVSSNAPVFKNNIESIFVKDSIVDFGSTECKLNGNTVNFTVLTTYPSGRTQTSKSIILDELGLYSTVYTASGSDITFTKYYVVENDNSALWVENKAIEVEANVDAPDYADYSYNGTMLTASRQAEAVYKNTVDLSDNTKNDVLCEFFVAPKVAGTIETSRIDIIFTDVHNPENVVDIMFALGVWNPTQKENVLTSVTAMTQRDYNDGTFAEIFKGSTAYEKHYYYSRRVYSSLYGKSSVSGKEYPSQSVKFYFDYKEGKVYVNNSGVDMSVNLVADLTDESHVGAGKAFKGFTTGEVKMSVKVSGLSQPAHVMMLNIDGQSMSGEKSNDTVAPSIFVDYNGNKENDLPNGIVGMPYKIFTAHSVDLVDGLNKNVDISVYRKAETLEKIEFIGGEFIPQTAGEYVIRYSSTDVAGLTRVKDVIINVVAPADYEEISYEFSPLNPSEAFVGNEYTIYSGTYSGGTGNISENITVTFGGQPVVVNNDGVFSIDKKGTYTIKVVLHDYIKQSNTYIFNIDAKYSSEPIIDLKTMPKSLVVGDEVTLPEFTATLYSEQNPNGTAVNVEYYVNGSKIENRKFKPTVAGDITISIKYGGETIDYVVCAKEKVGFSAQYTTQFYNTDAKTVTPSENGTILTFDNDCNVTVSRQINANFVNMKLAGVEGKCNLSTIEYVLTDSVDPNVSVTIRLEKRVEDGAVYIINSGVRYLSNATFDNPSIPIDIGLSSDGYITNKVTAGYRKVIKITKTDSGRTFEGFPSGSIYLEIKFKDVASESAFSIERISAQDFTKYHIGDNKGPEIKMLGTIGEVELDGKVIIPAAVAYDLASGVKGGVTVTVTSPSGRYLVGTSSAGVAADKEYEITLEEVGDYTIEYTATDLLGKTTTKEEYVTVMDKVPPEIKISGKVPTSGKVNTEITLPSMTVSDDHTETEDILKYIYYIAPNGKVVRMSGTTFTPDQKGQYIVVYFAQDSHNATTILRYVIEVM